MVRRLCLVPVCGAALLACHDAPAPVRPACYAYAAPAVEVEIADAATGAPLASVARGAVRDGRYVDSLEFGPPAVRVRRAAYERPGTYAVEVLAPGYLPWRAEGV